MSSKPSFLDFDIVEEANAYTLYQKSIKYLKKLSSDTWTEFNIHDPGMTLIENLCVAISVISVRAIANIEEFITYKGYNNAVLTKEDAFSVYPITEYDIRKFLIDAFEEVDNIWIEDVPLEVTSFKGYHQLIVKFKDGFYKKGLLNKILEKAQETRSLCENIISIKLADQKTIQVVAEIDLGFNVNTEEAIANVLYKLYSYFTPNIRQHSISKLQNYNLPSSESYEGPNLKNGYLYNHDLYERKESLLTSDIIREIMTLKEVVGVRNLGITFQGETYYSVLELDKCIPIYDIGSLDFMHFFKNGVRCISYNKDQVKILFEQKKLSDLANTYQIEELDQNNSKKRSINKAILEKTSLTNNFPSFYGLEEKNSLLTKEQYQKNEDLKTYISFYEDSIEEFLNQLYDIPKLFSSESVIRSLLNEDHEHQILSNHFKEYSKINEILDLFITVYGETFIDEGITSFHSDFIKKEEFLKKSILYKLCFLRCIHHIQKGRNLAENKKSNEESNLSVLELRLILFLGLGEVDIKTWNIKLPSSSIFQKLGDTKTGSTVVVEKYQFIDCIDTDLEIALDAKDLELKHLINQEIIENGIDYKNLRIGYDFLDNTYDLLLQCEHKHYLIKQFSSWRYAEKIGVMFHRESIQLQNQLETFIFIEHQKLQPSADDLTFGISILDENKDKVLVLNKALDYKSREALLKKLPEYILDFKRYEIQRNNSGEFYLTFEIPEQDIGFQGVEIYTSVQKVHSIKEELYYFLSNRYRVFNFDDKILRHIVIDDTIVSLNSIVDESFFNFSISLLFPKISNRFKDKEFQSLVDRLCRKFVPAHLSYHLKWVDINSFNLLTENKYLLEKENDVSTQKIGKKMIIKELLNI